MACAAPPVRSLSAYVTLPHRPDLLGVAAARVEGDVDLVAGDAVVDDHVVPLAVLEEANGVDAVGPSVLSRGDDNVQQVSPTHQAPQGTHEPSVAQGALHKPRRLPEHHCSSAADDLLRSDPLDGIVRNVMAGGLAGVEEERRGSSRKVRVHKLPAFVPVRRIRQQLILA
eukprot:767228-Hanusia_phi.AAC.7